ncbi:MAG: KH domain-containing protein [archaeon]
MGEKSSSEVLIPLDRVGALIGKKSETKREIERKAKVKLKVDSETGAVTIVGEPENMLVGMEIVKAIGRGFSPKVALKLLKPDFILDVIDLTDEVSETQLNRVRGRLIGSKGKTREYISQLTDVDISVYGKTVSFIGTPEKVALAKRCMEMLISGAQHQTVYRFLEKEAKMLKEAELFDKFDDSSKVKI